jgi:hypothetical protein
MGDMDFKTITQKTNYILNHQFECRVPNRINNILSVGVGIAAFSTFIYGIYFNMDQSNKEFNEKQQQILFAENLRGRVMALADKNHDGVSFPERLDVYDSLGIKYDLRRGLPDLTTMQMYHYVRNQQRPSTTLESIAK